MPDEGKFTVDAKWTDDCQGKKDYDGDIISVSTRYWPRGGGFTTIHNDGREIRWEENDARPYIKPSAKAAIVLRGRNENGGIDTIDLSSRDFEAETFEEVKAMVEEWVDIQYARIITSMFMLFYPDRLNIPEEK